MLEGLQGMDVALVGMASFAKCLTLSGCSQAPGSFLLLALLHSKALGMRGLLMESPSTDPGEG